jgi:hypothetical protein
VDLQAVWQSPLPRLLAFNCEDEGVYQCRLAYAGFARNAYDLVRALERHAEPLLQRRQFVLPPNKER